MTTDTHEPLVDNFRAASIVWLRTIAKPGDKLATIQRHRTRSVNGNSTYYVSVLIVNQGDIVDLTRSFRDAFNLGYDYKRDCLKTSYDARWLVQYLGDKLYPNRSERFIFEHQEL